MVPMQAAGCHKGPCAAARLEGEPVDATGHASAAGQLQAARRQQEPANHWLAR